jgi:hypothetical protein
MNETEKQLVNSYLKQFYSKLTSIGRALQVSASLLKIRQSSFLFVGKDLQSFHIIFSESPGENKLNYRDLTSQGRLELSSIVHQVRIEVGDVIWAFSLPINILAETLEKYIEEIVIQYVNTVLESQKKPTKKISEEAISNPEIASGVEKFNKDYPDRPKIAFIIMQFGSTPAHNTMVQIIKDTLNKFNIVGLRADDKQYLDDLFPNVKVYLHCCTFGIVIFDRITEDDFNSNISLEVGYLLGMNKNVLLLKDKTLKSLPTDLTGELYKEFDTQCIEITIPPQIEKWLKDKGII